MTIALPIAFLKDAEQQYAPDGNKLTSQTSEMLAMSKDGRKFLKHITPRALKEAKKIKDEKPMIIYRDAAAKNFATWSKPTGISVTIEDKQVIIDIFLKNNTVMGVSHNDMMDVTADKLDSKLAHKIIEQCVKALATHYAKKKATVWNLGHDANKWPSEVQHILADTVIANIKKLGESDEDGDMEDIAKSLVPNVTKGLEKLEGLGIDMEIFGYRAFQAIHYMTFSDHTKPVESAEGLADRMKEVEMEEHGYRFAPPQGTTMH